MRLVLAKIGDHARGFGIGIGWISVSLGLALTLAPRKTAGFLGWSDRERLARVIGGADLVVGTGLLVSTRPSRWMLGRTLLNVVIGGVYAGVLAGGTPERGRTIFGVCLMSGLTANDYFLSRRLREIEAPYNLTTKGDHRPWRRSQM